MRRIFFASLWLMGCVSISTQNTLNYTTAVNLNEIQSFDIYQDDDTLHALVLGLKNHNDRTQTLRYLQSTDNGKHWSDSIEIPYHFSYSLASRGNYVQLAVNGKNIVALWQTQGELPNYGGLVSVYSHDGGKTWQMGKNPAVDNSGDQSHADVIADKNGNFHVVWLADPEENGYQSLRYARSVDNGESWQPSQKLDDSSCSCCSNTFAISPDNQLHVFYRDMNPRDMVLFSSNDFGANWQKKETIGKFNWHFDGCPHVGGAITFDDNNNFFASVWTGKPSESGLYTVNSLTQIPVRISKNATHSDIVLFDNKLILVWDEMTKDGTGIFVAQSHDKGMNWSMPHRLSVIGKIATHPRIVASENNTLILWTEKQLKQPNQWAMSWLD